MVLKAWNLVQYTASTYPTEQQNTIFFISLQKSRFGWKTSKNAVLTNVNPAA